MGIRIPTPSYIAIPAAISTFGSPFFHHPSKRERKLPFCEQHLSTVGPHMYPPFRGPQRPFGVIGLEVDDGEVDVAVVLGRVPPAHMPYAGLQF